MVGFDFNNEKISIVLRTTGINKFNIERAIFSIYCSSYQNKEVVIIYQGLDEYFRDYIENIFKIYGDEVGFLFFQNKNVGQDQRSRNINIGIENSNGRYLAILDDDDFVNFDHYYKLIKLMKDDNYVWGYSLCIRNDCENGYLLKRNYEFFRDYNFNDLVIENFIPIHCFIIDRLSLGTNQKIIKTDENITRLEDYFVLLNLASRYKPIINKSVGVYYNFEVKKIEESKRCHEYEYAREKINNLKKLIIEKHSNVSLKNKKNFVSIFFKLIMILLFLIPKIGYKIVKTNKCKKSLIEFNNYIERKIFKIIKKY